MGARVGLTPDPAGQDQGLARVQASRGVVAAVLRHHHPDPINPVPPTGKYFHISSINFCSVALT